MSYFTQKYLMVSLYVFVDSTQGEQSDPNLRSSMVHSKKHSEILF